MAYPDWVEKQKRRGCEIKKIKGNYYMYERKSKWDPERKKAKKVTGAYLGKVTPDGVIPPKTRIGSTPVSSLEYGASMFLYGLAGDLLEGLRRHFDEEIANSIWVTAMLKLISPCPFKRIAGRYESSWMSRLLPDLALSSSSFTRLLDHVGRRRAACAEFMRETMEPSPYLLIDGTGTISYSAGMQRALPGHSLKHGFTPQMNQIYVLSVSDKGSLPAFYRNVAGNVPDVTAFKLTVEDAGIESATVVADAGFASKDNFELLNEFNEQKDARLEYIVPLKRNSKEVDLHQIEYEDIFTYHKRAVSAHSEQRDAYRICVFRDERMRSEEMADFVERKEKANATAEQKKSFSPEELLDVAGETREKVDTFGTIIIRTSLMEQQAQKIYETYKLRWEIEQLFDTMRNTCDADVSHMQTDTAFEAWAFINHVTLIAACRVLALLREKKMLKKWSLADAMEQLSHIHAVQIANQWRLAEIVKRIQDMMKDLSISIDDSLLPKR